MYVHIGNEDYSEIKSLSFAPDADLTGDSLPVNSFTVDVITDDEISIGATAALYDDTDVLFASYSIIYAERVQENIVRIKAESIIGVLSRRNRDLAMYENEPVTNILANLFMGLSNAYTLDSSFSGVLISGYCPPQTCRERLQWLCMVMGAYCKTAFNTCVEILPVDDSNMKSISMVDTFWRPEIVYKDYVTKITVRAYTYTQGTPDVTDEWISDGTSGDYYIQTWQDYSLTNSAAPAGAPENEVKVTDVTIINPANVSAVLSRLAAYYFNRDEINLSAINNGDYHPGDYVMAFVDDLTIRKGFIRTAVFSFGLQAKSALKLIMTGGTDSAVLIIKRMYGNTQLAREVYRLPVGYAYSFENRFIDMLLNGHRYVFRPTTPRVEGTIASGTQTKNVAYAVALDYHENILHIVSVDDSTEPTAGEVEIE